MRPELILNQVKDYIETNLPGFMSEIESERSITIPRPTLYKAGINQGREAVYIEVLLGPVTHDYGNESAPTVDLTTEYTVNVAYTVASKLDVDQAQLALYRFSEALTNLVVNDDTFGGQYIWVKLGPAGELPPITVNTRLKQTYVVGLIIRKLE